MKNFLTYSFSFFVCNFYFFSKINAQENDLGTWNIYNARLELDSKWSLFFEPQLRSLSFYRNFHYYEIKSGVNYRLNKNFGFSVGGGDYNTYRAGDGDFITPMQNKEFRTWVQVNMYNYLDKLKVEHRYRAEQRFGTNQYRNRFRYRLALTLPLFKHQVEKRTFYVTASNELFLGDEAPFFQRNRLFAGVGYEFTPFLAIQMGLMNQFDYQIDDETGKNFLQISILMDFKSQRKNKESVPTTEN